MKIAMITSEAVPYAKTGGLADVSGALPRALGALGVETTVVLPLYRACRKAAPPPRPTGRSARVSWGGGERSVPLWEASPYPGVRFLFLESDPLYDRPSLYGEQGKDYPDNLERFHLLARGGIAALEAMGTVPDVVHAHDWQAALAPTLLLHSRNGSRPHPATVATVHNLAFQGLFPPETFPTLGLPAGLYRMEGMEFWGKVNLLKGALLYSDALTTVSPTYAREIQTAEFGCGLEGVLRERSAVLQGILNGIDTEEWDPASDRFLSARYSPRDLSGKSVCKGALLEAMGLAADPSRPLAAFVGRLTHQKGVDLILEGVDAIVGDGVALAFLGTGEPEVEASLRQAAARHPGRIAARIGFDNALAHQMEAGADFFLMPSRFEPCGLNQMISLRYGTIPVVRGTGGLEDTIEDADGRPEGNGFKFAGSSPEEFQAAFRRALKAFRDPKRLGLLRRRGMEGDYSWTVSARRYLDLYRSAAARRGG